MKDGSELLHEAECQATPHQHCQTRRRIHYVAFGVLAGGATALNWILMQTKGYSVPALAVLTSFIAWLFLLGALLPLSYLSLLEADVTEVGYRPTVARLIFTSVLTLSALLAFLTCWFLRMPLVIPMSSPTE